MIFLGIETATSMCSVALADEQGVIGEYKLLRGLSHAERLPGAVRVLLDDTKISQGEIDGIGVSIGPGSFTGLRIGLGFAKGLAMGWQKPLFSVSTMAGILSTVPTVCKTACVMLTARRIEVYRGLFCHQNKSWQPVGEIEPVLSESLLDGLPEGPILFTGEGLLPYRSIINQRPESHMMPEAACYPTGHGIAKMGLEAFKHEQPSDIDQLSPVYIKLFQGVN